MNEMYSEILTNQNMSQIDRSIENLFSWVEIKGVLKIKPEWQRSSVWSPKHKSYFIESCLLGCPIQPLFLLNKGDNTYDVIDGQQRLAAIVGFIKNEYKLARISEDSPFLNKFYKDLSENDSERFLQYPLQTFVVSPTVSDITQREVFERINSTGINLNETEKLNSKYNGPLLRCARSISTKNKSYQDILKGGGNTRRFKPLMLVLGFFAIFEKGISEKRKSTNMNKFIEDYCIENQNMCEDKLDRLKREFGKTIKLCHTVFGTRAFRSTKSTGRLNSTLFYAITCSFQRHAANHLIRSGDAINELYFNLLTDNELMQHWDKKRSIRSITTFLEEWEKGLKYILDTYQEGSGNRFFSKRLKVELYSKDPTCSICGQEIRFIEDAAMDHHEQYWHGGLTVPENARLVHRHCNNSRPRSEKTTEEVTP